MTETGQTSESRANEESENVQKVDDTEDNPADPNQGVGNRRATSEQEPPRAAQTLQDDIQILGSQAETDDDARLLVWGRCIMKSEEGACVFFLDVKAETGQPESLRVLGFQSPDVLPDFDLRDDPRAFHRSLDNFQAVPERIDQPLRERLHQALETQVLDSDGAARLSSILQSETIDQFEEWNREWLREGKSEVSWYLQCRGMVGSLEGEPLPETDNENERTLLDISLMTSPAKGIPSSEVEPGDEVSLRVRGESIKYLPPSKIDQKRDRMSIPLTGTITELRPEPDFPEDFPGSPENYQEVIVKLDEAIHGRGFMFNDDKIKVHREQLRESSSHLTVYVLASVLVLLVLVVVAVFFL